ncbi:unnamed protein product [Brassica rapa]|uniref:non-specific serine/threonine protein kinase n=1 Tax=Brassica campestris TaxID=3711 RepID=A0A8D9M2J5_BRACM|nr:unnamed protein product [Brassica rapa]
MSDLEDRERSGFAPNYAARGYDEEERIARKLKEEVDRIRAMYAKKRGGFETPQRAVVVEKKIELEAGAEASVQLDKKRALKRAQTDFVTAEKTSEAEQQRNIVGVGYQAYEDKVMERLRKAFLLKFMLFGSGSQTMASESRTRWVLPYRTKNLKDDYLLGRVLGQGQFGTTFLCSHNETGQKLACKSIPKRTLLCQEDCDQVLREIQIMHHLSEYPNVVRIQSTYEDETSVHLVMELCEGGELFDRIAEKDTTFSELVGSAYYVAPEVLLKHYGRECDVWSAGVILYVLLCGFAPFDAGTDNGIFREILQGKLDFETDPWPSISESAKDLTMKMLESDPKKRLTAHQVLCHPWIVDDTVAPDKPLDFAVVSRLKRFSAMNKLKKMALRVVAERLSEEEIGGLKELFKMIDRDNSGTITFKELKDCIRRVGSELVESEIQELLQAADVDGSGTIDYGEFLAATIHLNKLEREENLVAAFSFFDKDSSGCITLEELQQAWKQFGIKDSNLDKMIKDIDQDNDGQINYGEFVAMMRKGNGNVGISRRTMRNTLNFENFLPE